MRPKPLLAAVTVLLRSSNAATWRLPMVALITLLLVVFGLPDKSGSQQPAPASVQVQPSESSLDSLAPAPELDMSAAVALAPAPPIQPLAALPEGSGVVMAPPPPVAARAFAVVERSCGTVLAGKDEHFRMAPASLTKIITALVVRHQNIALEDIVPIQVSGSRMAKQGSSVMGLEPGMQMSVRDLLYGLSLPSGNDAAMALAQYVGQGNLELFDSMMNEEAATLGMRDSHFSNPHGLDDLNLYSSAYDMAIAGRALLADQVLADIADTPVYTPAWPGGSLKNGNKLLSSYPGAFGVKIGYTENAQETIVAAAERNGRQIIVSVLGSLDRYADSKLLLDWAFARTIPSC